MRISHRHRFVFFAAPKTGSRSVRKLLDPHSEIHGRPGHDVTPEFPFYNHIRPVELRDIFQARGWDFDGYFKFTMVRNPWSRLVSLYEMFAFREGGLLSRLRRPAKRHLGFRQWVRDFLPEGPGHPTTAAARSVIRVGALPYLGFAGDELGRPLVDEVFKLEEIEIRLPLLLRRMGLPEQGRIPQTGRGRYGGDFRDYYDEETRELISQRYREDIQRFGYSFGPEEDTGPSAS